MALIPVSLFFEFFLVVLGFILLDGRLPSRMAAMGCFTFVIVLVTNTQIYVLESSGALSDLTRAYPTALLGPLVFVLMIFWYVALANLFEYVDRDIIGRRRR